MADGFLVQQNHRFDAQPDDWTVVTDRQPSPQELADASFAWRVCGHVNSNAIVLAKDGVAWGIGAGQQNRVESGEIAASKAAGRAEGGACASDAFYPFPDGIHAAADAGAAIIVQPGGSVGDEQTIAAATSAGSPWSSPANASSFTEPRYRDEPLMSERQAKSVDWAMKVQRAARRGLLPGGPRPAPTDPAAVASVTVEGTEHLDTPGPVILAPVHRSNLDSVLVACTAQRRLRALGKESLFTAPVFAWVNAALGAIPVRRGEADRQAMKAAQTIIADGAMMIVFRRAPAVRRSGARGLRRHDLPGPEDRCPDHPHRDRRNGGGDGERLKGHPACAMFGCGWGTHPSARGTAEPAAAPSVQ